jgi:hypothetical protein
VRDAVDCGESVEECQDPCLYCARWSPRGDHRYERLAGPLFGLFRHGIAHTFLPEVYEDLYASLLWRDICAERLEQQAVDARLQQFRASHLIVRVVGDIRTLQVVPQLLYVAVRRVVLEFSEALISRTFDVELFGRNFDRWEEANSRLEDRFLNESERAALGLPPKRQ